jgi:hypothetical protein
MNRLLNVAFTVFWRCLIFGLFSFISQHSRKRAIRPAAESVDAVAA